MRTNFEKGLKIILLTILSLTKGSLSEYSLTYWNNIWGAKYLEAEVCQGHMLALDENVYILQVD